jgi:hypothetical protein
MSELLQKIKATPGVFLGKISAERLDQFLNGYSYRCFEESGYGHCLYPRGFVEYLAYRFEMHARSASDIVLSICDGDDEKAFYMLFELIDEFLQHNQVA